ncbi:MAG TPA: phage head-tail connector protein, partial [Anaerolineae bacterium]|nr:phage head-tail connector protein [Anaerolineae bacterium]
MATYVSLEDLRGELGIEATGDNPLLQEAIEDAQSYIESQTNRVFEATTATRQYDSDARDRWDS